jgi:hypothetical protein
VIIIGVDYHPSFQQIAFCNQDTGEYGERPWMVDRRKGGCTAGTMATKKLLLGTGLLMEGVWPRRLCNLLRRQHVGTDTVTAGATGATIPFLSCSVPFEKNGGSRWRSFEP